MDKKITFIIPNHNTLPYLKLAYKSIRDNSYTKHSIIILDDNSTDGSLDWLTSIKGTDKDLKILSFERKYGHTILYNIGVEKCRTEIFCIFHSDMVMGLHFDFSILKNIDRRTVVSGTRIEPPLHPPGKEKIIQNFGMTHFEFDYSAFSNFVSEEVRRNMNLTTKGIFAPWAMYRDDFLEVGGHDKLFAPYPLEDSDIFQRFILNGYDIIQARDAFVYHFTCRGHKLIDDSNLEKEDQNYSFYNTRAQYNFIRKWGMLPRNDENMLPFISKKMDLGLIYNFKHSEILLSALEPFFNTIYVENEYIGERYVKDHQKDTLIDLSKKFVVSKEFKNDIKITLIREELDNTDLLLLHTLQYDLTTSGKAKNKSNNLYVELIDDTVPNSTLPPIKV